MTSWMMQLGTNLTVAGGYSDKLEIPWIKECYSKTFDELREAGNERMIKADLALNQQLTKLIQGTQEAIKNELWLKQLDCYSRNDTLGKADHPHDD